jgi:Fur family ferric uptake transcriptional regulator
LQKIEEITKNSSFRITKARNEILNTLIGASKPLSYDEFNLSMDKATFYRNVAKFEEENLINKFESEDKKWYFEIVTKPHAHFICKSCKKVECIEKLSLELEDYQIDSVILKGICGKCLTSDLGDVTSQS